VDISGWRRGKKGETQSGVAWIDHGSFKHWRTLMGQLMGAEKNGKDGAFAI
jgi:hypothetical protein